MAETRTNGVLVLTLNRPKALNALSDELMRELSATLSAADSDNAVRAIVLTGSERAFAAGADIAEMHSRDASEVTRSDMLGFWQDMTAIRKPIIAAVSGYALGGGCELAMMCDILVASETAMFGQPEILLGTIPGAGGTQRLTRAVGKSKAMEWILTGRKFTALEAEKAGLVSKVVPAEEVVEEAVKIAIEIANHSMPVVALAKQAVNMAFEASLSEGLAYERKAFHGTWALEDRREGMSAFLEKRKPTWSDK